MFVLRAIFSHATRRFAPKRLLTITTDVHSTGCYECLPACWLVYDVHESVMRSEILRNNPLCFLYFLQFIVRCMTGYCIQFESLRAKIATSDIFNLVRFQVLIAACTGVVIKCGHQVWPLKFLCLYFKMPNFSFENFNCSMHFSFSRE
jgi:hypothetical protein